jgi:glycosyltransferase involved in cell wall biosynthesis
VTEVRLHFARDLDVRSWELRNAADEAADHWPYGLHHLAAHGVTPVPVPARFPRAVMVGRRLGGGCDWDRVLAGGDAALCWDERPGVPVALSGVPTLTGVIWLTEPRRRRPADALLRRGLARAEVFVLSELQVAPLVSEWGLDASRVHVVPFGVDPDFWHPREGSREGVIVVGNDRHRDHPTAIRAAQGASARLTMVTSIPVPVPQVPYYSHRELRQAYADHAVVAVATTPNNHASGVTNLLEAMACGRPVVATRGGGLEHYVTPQTGILVDPGDDAAMAEAIRSLLADPARAAAMGAAGRAAVETQFCTSRMSADLAQLVLGLR